jgi:hypothetical protein
MVVPSRLMRKVECPIQAREMPPLGQAWGSGRVAETNFAESVASTSPASGSRVKLFHQIFRERIVRSKFDISEACAHARWGRQAAAPAMAARSKSRRRVRWSRSEEACEPSLRCAMEILECL